MAKAKTSQKLFKKTNRLLRKNLLSIFLTLILIILTLTTYELFASDKFYPLTFVGNTNISFLKKDQAEKLIDEILEKRLKNKLKFIMNEQIFEIDLATSSAKINYSTLDETLSQTHSGTIAEQLLIQIQNIINIKKIEPKISFNLESQLDQIALAVDKLPVDAKINIDKNLEIDPSENGWQLDKETLQKEIIDYALMGVYKNNLSIKIVKPKITTEHILKIKKALEENQKQSLKLNFKGNIFVLDNQKLIDLLDLKIGKDVLDKDKTYAYIKDVAKQIDQDVQEALFEFNTQTGRVSQFKPSKIGQKLDQDRTFELLISSLTTDGNRSIELPVEIIKPKIETENVNSLGIKELIGKGISNFSGSIPNRIYNIKLTASKINGILVPPGDVFSFNQTVGDITAATGFKQAYVIKEGRTVLDDGGGVCQDSTTLFRAVLNAGLPVLKRTAHAYRVGYYEQGFPPGLDATVFYPSVDFQFKNDTSSHILIQAYTVGTTLYIDLYGTSDQRLVTLTKPTVSDLTPPPPELRQDDPTLPKGEIKQVDFPAWGANVSFSRTVTRNEETLISETFRSNYRPWQAIYLVGTQ